MKQELRNWQLKHSKTNPTDVPVGSQSEWHLDKRMEGIFLGHFDENCSEGYVGQHYVKYKEGRGDLINDIAALQNEIAAEEQARKQAEAKDADSGDDIH